jgi:hypothetical protein
MKQGFWEAVSCSAIQVIPHILQNPNICYFVNKIPAIDFIQSQMKPIHTLAFSSYKIQ